MPYHQAIQGVVGSTAYGLAREGSDIDRLGVFIAPSHVIAGFDWTSKNETETNSGPVGDDFTVHEVGKFLKLALKCNPTVSELLWLGEYETLTVYGQHIVNNKESFLSQEYAHNAYLGYAHSQLRKFRDMDFKPKHARHTLRLLKQGFELMKDGRVNIKVDDPDIYFAFDTMEPEKTVRLLEDEFYKFNSFSGPSPLREKQDASVAREILTELRLSFP